MTRHNPDRPVLRARRTACLAATSAALILHHPSLAATASWASPASGRWLDAANWNPATLPTSSTPVSIATPGTYTVTLDASTTVGALILNNPNATLSVAGTNVSLNTGDILLSAGHLVLGQSPTGTANLIASNGSGSLTNQGTIDIYAPVSTGSGVGLSATIVNAGTINVAVGAPTFTRTVTNTGSLVAPAGTKFIVTGSTFNQNAGSLSGTLTFSGSTFNYNGGSADLVYLNRLSPTTTLNFGPGGSAGTFATVPSANVSLSALPAGNTLYICPGSTVNFSGTSNYGHLAYNRPAPGYANPGTTPANLTFTATFPPTPFTNYGTLDIDNSLSYHTYFDAPLVN